VSFLVFDAIADVKFRRHFGAPYRSTGMEQAQIGVLGMDWFIASLQPMRWIKSLAGVYAPAGGAH
jgi:hypothetical protein